MDTRDLRFRISPSEALTGAWNTTFAHFGIFIGFSILYFIVAFSAGLIPYLNILINLLGFVFACSLYSGFDAAQKVTKPDFGSLFLWTPRFGKLLLGYLVYILLVVALLIPAIVLMMITLGADFFMKLAAGPSGFVYIAQGASATFLLGLTILVLAGAVMIYVLTFAFLFLLQFRDYSIGEALRTSIAVGRENVGAIIWFVIISIGLSILGFLACGLGLLIAVPLIYGMQFHMLRSIFPNEESNQWDFMSDKQQPNDFL